jgi:hypothetical protein
MYTHTHTHMGVDDARRRPMPCPYLTPEPIPRIHAYTQSAYAVRCHAMGATASIRSCQRNYLLNKNSICTRRMHSAVRICIPIYDYTDTQIHRYTNTQIRKEVTNSQEIPDCTNTVYATTLYACAALQSLTARHDTCEACRCNPTIAMASTSTRVRKHANTP